MAFKTIKRFFGKVLNKEKGGLEYFRYTLAEILAKFVYKRYYFSEFGNIWLDDKKFLEWYDSIKENNHSADRKYLLINLLKAVVHLEGDTVECGVYKGDSSYLICKDIAHLDKQHHVFDSFQGLSLGDSSFDNAYWKKGDLSIGKSYVESRLNEFNFIKYYEGWIPEKFSDVDSKKFCFVHIDVDLYQPTYDSVAFFYSRMVTGGIILCDDYGFRSCAGAKKAVDEFLADKPEQIVMTPTGQAFIIKR